MSIRNGMAERSVGLHKKRPSNPQRIVLVRPPDFPHFGSRSATKRATTTQMKLDRLTRRSPANTTKTVRFFSPTDTLVALEPKFGDTHTSFNKTEQLATDLAVPTTARRAVRKPSSWDASYWPQLTVAAHLQKFLVRVVRFPGVHRVQSLAQPLPHPAFIKCTLFMVE